jgi:hypothetical protein
MLKYENHYFQIREDYFCGLFDRAFTPKHLNTKHHVEITIVTPEVSHYSLHSL